MVLLNDSMKKPFVVVVVLYNNALPNYENLIRSNNDIIIIVVDNTLDRKLPLSRDNYVYLPLSENTGIAHALNIGCLYAIEKYNAEWVLTMDQDSIIPSNMIYCYSSFVNSANDAIGLICPLINVYNGENKKSSNNVVEVKTALSSGSYINMRAYKEIGGFKDELFIDEVDFDYCYRLRLHGYRIFQLNYVTLQHQLGNTKEYRLLGKHLFYVLNHNCLRHYYMQRNSLYMSKWYSKRFPELKRPYFNAIIAIVKVILFEDNKLKKIRYRIKGYLDYKNSILGKYIQK